MPKPSFADNIHSAYLAAMRPEVAAGVHPNLLVADHCRPDQLVDIAHDRTAPIEVQDRAWAAAILAYQRGPRDLWGAVLLEMAAAALARAVARYFPPDPALDEDDLRQLLVIAFLEAAATITVPSQPRRMMWRVVNRARSRVNRQLRRERRHRHVDEMVGTIARDQAVADAWLRNWSNSLYPSPRRREPRRRRPA